MTHNHTPVAVALDGIDDNPYQTRLAYDDETIVAIAASIAVHGLLQVPLARQVAGRYQLAFGHSRKRAFDLLRARNPTDWLTMPLIVRDLDDETMFLHAWSENKDRKDLNAVEEARAIERSKAFGWKQAQIAQKLGLSESAISNKLRLLKLPAATLDQVQAGQLSERQAAALLPLMELPDGMRAQPGPWYGMLSANEVIQTAGQYDSTELRRRVDSVLNQQTTDLATVAWINQSFSIALHGDVVSSRCCDCEHYRMKSRNRCLLQSCYDAKVRAYAIQQAQAAADSLGVRPLPTLDYGTYSDVRGVDVVALRAKATEKACANLGVMHKAGLCSSQRVDGFDQCYVVCAHGAGKRCGCIQSLQRSSDPLVHPGASKKAERETIKTQLQPLAREAIIAALDAPSPSFWSQLLKALDLPRWRQLADARTDQQPADLFAALAQTLISRALGPDEAWPSPTGAQARLQQLCLDLGAADPWAPTRQGLHAKELILPSAPTAPPLPAEAQARAAALGVSLRWHPADGADGADAAYWEVRGVGARSVLPPTVAPDAESLLEYLRDDLVVDLAFIDADAPGMVLDPSLGVSDRMMILDFMSDLAAAETGADAPNGLRHLAWLDGLQDALAGLCEVLSDDVYESLAKRLSALQVKEGEVVV